MALLAVADVEVRLSVPLDRLFRPEHLTYAGAFRVPASVTFEFPGQGLAVSERGLFITGKSNDATNLGAGQKTAEISRPTPVIATSLAKLPVATFLQPFTEPTEGQIAQAKVSGTNIYIGDYLVVGDRLCFVLFAYYDGASTQTRTLCSRPVDLSRKGEVVGPVTVSSSAGVKNVTRFVNGYLAEIPKAHQAALGGPHAIGGTPSSISSGASNGDAFFATDLTEIADNHRVDPALYFTQAHPLGIWNQQSALWNGTTGSSTAAVIPDGFDSVLFIKRLGLGEFGYGNGTADPKLVGTVNANGVKYWYDPAVGPKGDHAYPYVIRVNAYRIADLVAVREGRLLPWEPRPYASWTIDLPFSTIVAPLDPLRNGLSGKSSLFGTAYDPSTRELFLSTSGDGSRPLIHVLQVAA